MTHEHNPTAAIGEILEAETRRGDTVAVALSGGMDSAALLDAALSAASGRKIAACHVNHGISAASDAWERFCEQLCESRGVQLFARRAPPTEKTTEKWARNARMQAFSELPVRAILAAHHADDQAETVLFRLLRGTGAHGLGAMRAVVPLPGADNNILLLRPWLGIPRQEIADYARRRRLCWVEDDDNRNLERRRNFLRQRAMLVLREYFPDCGRTLATAAARLDAASLLLASLAEEDEKKAGGEKDGWDLDYFQEAGAARLQNWLHVRLLRNSARFSERGLVEAARQIIAVRRGETSLQFAGMNLRVWKGRLYLDSLPPLPPFFRVPLKSGQERYEFPELGGALVLRRAPGGALSGNTGEPLVAQLRRGGERINIEDGNVRAVSDLLRDAEIPPWRRRRLPLLFVGKTLAAIPGIAVAPKFRARQGENGINCRMEWI